MLFCSGQFLAFFVVVFAVYWSVPWARFRTWLLLAASIYFYACWSPWLAGLVFASTVLDYGLARAIEALKAPGWRRGLVAVSVTANLGLLCFFKYTNFFLSSLEEMLKRCGASASFPVLSLLAPIGVSFYTFEAINYVVDVYRGRLRAERSLPHLLLFILFFPHLVAGPIVRARDFLPQIGRRKHWDWLRVRLGVRFFLLGLFKKWVIADRMALLVNPVFAHPGEYNAVGTWTAVVAYALQIYGDFSGYSDMAVGCAHLLGFKLAKNFDMPYLAANVAEFWRRWHISLSTWLRDYLFIPLGGSRGAGWITARNLLIVMTLGGLWHGAGWTFVVWGALHGLLLILHRLFRRFAEAWPSCQRLLRSAPGTVARVLTTFLAVSLCWIFFRAQSFADALLMFRGLGRKWGSGPPMSRWFVVAAILALLAGYALGRRDRWLKLTDRLPAPVVGVGYALLLAVCLLLAPITEKAFIYFQF